ncbi:MAG: GNAT family N-acetyltransferase [Caldiserica bacterium]|nr:GNAT family N-acetyltransferase [Caldisericota bacterium]
MNLETDRLRISKFFEQDWAMLQEIVIDKEHSTYAYMDHTWPTGDDQIKEICNGFAKGDEFLAVRTKQDNQLIGFVCLNNTDNPKNKNLGYCLHSSHQGQGFAFEACAALIKHAFEIQDIETISTGNSMFDLY